MERGFKRLQASGCSVTIVALLLSMEVRNVKNRAWNEPDSQRRAGDDEARSKAAGFVVLRGEDEVKRFL